MSGILAGLGLADLLKYTLGTSPYHDMYVYIKVTLELRMPFCPTCQLLRVVTYLSDLRWDYHLWRRFGS